MPSSVVVQQRAGDRTVVRFASALDLSTERWLRDFLGGLPPNADVTLDFSGVRDLPPVTLALLVQALSDTERAVRLSGLDVRHHRLLRYLGFHAGSSPSLQA